MKSTSRFAAPKPRCRRPSSDAAILSGGTPRYSGRASSAASAEWFETSSTHLAAASSACNNLLRTSARSAKDARSASTFSTARGNSCDCVATIRPTPCGRCQAIPRFADAEAVDEPGLQAFHHQRRRNGDKAHIAIRVHSRRGEPVTQVEVVIGEREHHAERERRAAIAQDGRKRAARSGGRLLGSPWGTSRTSRRTTASRPSRHCRPARGRTARCNRLARGRRPASTLRAAEPTRVHNRRGRGRGDRAGSPTTAP